MVAGGGNCTIVVMLGRAWDSCFFIYGVREGFSNSVTFNKDLKKMRM